MWPPLLFLRPFWLYLPLLWRWHSLSLSLNILVGFCFRFLRLFSFSFVIVRRFPYHRTTTNLLQIIFVYSFSIVWRLPSLYFSTVYCWWVISVNLKNACSIPCYTVFVQYHSLFRLNRMTPVNFKRINNFYIERKIFAFFFDFVFLFTCSHHFLSFIIFLFSILLSMTFFLFIFSKKTHSKQKVRAQIHIHKNHLW